MLLIAVSTVFFFLMIRRPPRSTLDRSSAASDVYKRQGAGISWDAGALAGRFDIAAGTRIDGDRLRERAVAVSYTHLRAHETVLDLVCRLLLEKQNK